MTGWGKAGVRLTSDEIEAKRRGRGERAVLDEQRRARDDGVDYELWRAGEVKPYRITMLLDAKGLDGPEVDVACGAIEPAVDLWEAGQVVSDVGADPPSRRAGGCYAAGVDVAGSADHSVCCDHASVSSACL